MTDQSDQPTFGTPTISKTQGLTIITLICIVIITIFVLHLHPKTQWEYKIIAIQDENFESSMDELGKDRWELVTARRASNGSTYNSTFSYEMIFKRVK